VFIYSPRAKISTAAKALIEIVIPVAAMDSVCYLDVDTVIESIVQGV